MAIDIGVDAKLYNLTVGTCSYSNDVLTWSVGTCTAIAYIDNYSIDMSAADIDITSFGDYVTKGVNGIQTVNISLSGSYDSANAQQDSLRTAQEAAAGTKLVFRLKKTVNKEARTFAARVVSYQDSATPSGKVSFSASLRGLSIPKTCTYT